MLTWIVNTPNVNDKINSSYKNVGLKGGDLRGPGRI